MATNDLHFVNYNLKTFWNKITGAYYEAGGDPLYPGNEIEMLLRAVLSIGVAIFADVDAAMLMDTLDGAQGIFLDIYGGKRGCYRIQATPAKTDIRIVFRATGYAKTIPAGTELTADGVVLYHLTEDVEQTGVAQTVETTIECSQAGAFGNALANGTQMQFINGSSAIYSVYTITDAEGGQDEEKDDDYRERIHLYGLAAVTTGPSSVYESAAMAVSTQILDAKALRDDDGEVGIYLILEDGASSASLIAAVESALSPVYKRPLTDHVTAMLATDVAYTLHCKVWYQGNLNLADKITEAKDEYKAWQDNTVGRAFNPDKLTAALYTLGVERVQYQAGDGIDGAGAVYTEIGVRERCVGTITLELVTT